MIDFHAHILPGIDDGSRDARMTEDMLQMESSQGVDLIVAAPHFYADMMSVEGFLEKRKRALERTEEIRRKVREEDGRVLPAVIPGAEVYYFPGIGRAEEISGLCIGDSRTILLEMPFEQWDEAVLRDVMLLIDKQKLQIVLAHLERYVFFQTRKDYWNRILELPLRVQFNAGTFLRMDRFLRPDRRKKFCLEYMTANSGVVLGSDCHNMTNRVPNLASGREVIAKKPGAGALERIDRAAEAAVGWK